MSLYWNSIKNDKFTKHSSIIELIWILQMIISPKPIIISFLLLYGKRYILTLIFFSYFFSIYAQVKKTGIPFIKNYQAENYRAASENWDILQDKRGMMFFGNHFGLLQFDGVRWQIVMQPKNKSMVRSLALDEKGRIYIGAQGDFGFVTPQPNGQYYYTSLLDCVPVAYRNFEDVWETVIQNDKVIFYALNALYIFKHNQIQVIRADKAFEGLFELNGQIYVLEEKKGLLKLNGDKLVPLSDGQKLAGMKIRQIFGSEDELIILTQKEGFFVSKQQQLNPWMTEADKLLKEGQVSCAMHLRKGYYMVGTRQNGLIVMDNSGQLIQHINTQSGLQNNYITNLGIDRQGNLWLTLKDGIDFVEISSPLSRIQDNNLVETKIYCSIIYQDRLYIGTDNGLFWLDWKAYKRGQNGKVNFQRVDGISENVWNLSIQDSLLLAFEANGTYQIEGNQAQLLAKTDGVWMGVKIAKMPDFLVVGAYTGLHLYKKKNNKWTFQQKIKGFNENCRALSSDQSGNLWMAHGYKGVYKIRLNQTLDSVLNIRFYNQRDGFPSSIFLNTFDINGQVLFGTTKGVYKKSNNSDKMVPDAVFTKYLGSDLHIRLLESDNKNNIWFVAGDITGVIHQYRDGSFHVEELAFRKLRYSHVPGFENIHTNEAGDVFFGTENGLIHYSSNITKNYQSEFASHISDVKCIKPGDSTLLSSLYNPAIQTDQPIVSRNPVVLPFFYNSLHFSYASLWYENIEATQYQYWLEGFETEWSDWSTQTEKEYTNLPEGTYVFHVRAKNLYDVISREDTFSFEIRPPWHRTKWAFIGYTILFVLLICGIIRYQRYLARMERNRLILNQERELLLKQAELNEQKLIAEQEKMDFIRENLESTIRLKNAKVAASTVNLIHLNEILLSIKDHLSQINTNSNDQSVDAAILCRINRIIDHELQGDHHWNEFEEIFNQLHDKFIQRLKCCFPELTPRDIRLCAYLRMNFNTKEIAPLLGISVRGVEDIRYRIRKKLHLSSDDNLGDFILNF